jgi:hypothetical protein
VIRVAITQEEHTLASKVLDTYARMTEADLAVRDIASIRRKLVVGNVSFTNKEANVLMDALNESDENLAGELSERLTGRS